MYTVKGIVGSNPTLSAINLSFSNLKCGVKIPLGALWAQMKGEIVMFGAGVSPPAQILIAIFMAGVFGLLAGDKTVFFLILAGFSPFIIHDFIVENKETNEENINLRKRVVSLEKAKEDYLSKPRKKKRKKRRK